MPVWQEGGERLKRNSIRRWIVLSFAVILVLSGAMSAAANYHEAYAGAMRKAVFALAGDTTQTRGVLLACDEALANIVNYSNADSLEFACRKEGEDLIVVFRTTEYRSIRLRRTRWKRSLISLIPVEWGSL